MKSNLETITSLQRKINVEVPAEAVRAAYDRVFQQLQKNVEIKGFRKGKAPLATIRSMYSDRVKDDVVQDIIQNFYGMALQEHSINPISYPDFEFDVPSELSDFKFSATFDVKPEVVLKKYEGLEVEKEKYSFDESKLDQVLQNIRNSRSSLQPVTEDRPVQMGDVAVIDFEGFVDGKALEGGAGKDHNLELGAKQFIEGFEEKVAGMKVGEEKNIDLQFPTPYHSADLAGKDVQFKVTLKEIKARVLPELNEEFLQSLGGPTDVEGLKNSIRTDMEQSETKKIEEAFKNRMLKTLVENNPVEVPPSLLNDQKQSLVEDFKKRMENQGMQEAEFQDYVNKWDQDFEKTAAEMIQASFLVDEIAKKHNLVCSKEDFEQKISDYVKQTGIEEARVREFYNQREQLSRLTYMITEDKVIKFLTEAAKIKEVERSLDQDQE